MFKPLYQEQENVYVKVVKRLKGSIVEGKLKPGDKLPAERVLAQMMGISRTSLREALKLLSAEGLVNIQHGKGVFIAENDPDHILKIFSAKTVVEKNTLKDFFEIRKVLETQAAIWAAERGTPEQIENLEKIVTDTMAEVAEIGRNNFTVLAKHDMLFHNFLAEASGNGILIRIMQDLIDLVDEARSHTLALPKRPYISLEEHQIIVSAIKERNKEKARDAMFNHLQNVEKDIF